MKKIFFNLLILPIIVSTILACNNDNNNTNKKKSVYFIHQGSNSYTQCSLGVRGIESSTCTTERILNFPAFIPFN